MKRSWKKLLTNPLAIALIAGFMLLTSSMPVSAQVGAGYSYTDDTFQIITDGGSKSYEFQDFGCGFESSADDSRILTNQLVPAETSPADASPVAGSPFCRIGSSISAANAYWATSDNNEWVVVNGDVGARQQPPVAANAGLYGNGIATLFIFSQPGTNPTQTTIGIGAPGAPLSMEPAFAGICRQDAGVLSWMICPAINFVNTFIEKLVGYVLDLLEIEPLLVGGQSLQENGLYIAWSQFRTLANILLIPIFLVSIYAMLFSPNNRYTVTRILPRLVIAALLMQLSFYIAAVIIDIGNVLAAGIAGIFNYVNASITEGVGNAPGQLPNSLGGTVIDRGIGGAIGVGLAIALGWFFLASALPPVMIIVTVFALGIIVTFLALALRQLAIVMFVVLAPIAFVFGVLPNTERWLREWFTNLAKLVMIYPLVVLFFSVASTLSLLARDTGQTDVNQFMAALLPIIALISVPLIFRFSGSLFKSVSDALANVSGRVKGGLVGDQRDPFSRAFQSRVGKLERRRNTTMRMANTSGLGWTARLTRPYDIQRQMYMAAGDRVKGYLSPDFPDRIRRLYMGEKAFNTRHSVEPYDNAVLGRTNDFRFEASRLRRSEAEMANMAEIAAAHAGGHADRGLAYMFGVGKQYVDGTMAEDVAESSFETIKTKVKGVQRHLGVLKFDDITNPWVQTPAADGMPNSDRLFQYGYGDYRQLATQADRDRNLGIKTSFLGVASGTLTEGQGEDVWYATAGALEDERIRERYQNLISMDPATISSDDQKFVQNVDRVLRKSEQLDREMAGVSGREQLQRQIESAAETEGGGPSGGYAGGYNKAGNELAAIDRFLVVSRELRQMRSEAGGDDE